MMIVWALLFMAFLARGENEGDRMYNKLKTLADNGLAADQMQEHFNKLAYRKVEVNGADILNKLSESLRQNFGDNINALVKLKDAVETSYRTAKLSEWLECCKITNTEYNTGFSSKVDVRSGCSRFSVAYEKFSFPLDNILETMKKNYENSGRNMKWQYVGFEDGSLLVYPAASGGCRGYDPRYRPWYVETATPEPKHVLIVIDQSGSMRHTTVHDRTLMDIAKEAAISVLDTLNPRDMANIVSFASEAHVPPGKQSTSRCYSTTLAKATPGNIEYLKDYIRNIDAGQQTNYSAALRKAFKLLAATPVTDNTERVMLFMTDGLPIDNKEEILKIIKTENEKLQNRVIILTYAIGEAAGASDSESSILKDMALQLNANRSFGERRPGEYKRISEPHTLRSAMSSYYDFFSPSSNTKHIFTVPYVDAWGLGFVTSICQPMYSSGTLIGVACIDLTLEDMFSEVTYFEEGKSSYAFVINGVGQALVHPLMPGPNDSGNKKAISIDINYLERSIQVAEILKSMKRGESGSTNVSSYQMVPRGDPYRDGVTKKEGNSAYYWTQIASTNFSVCIVLAVDQQHGKLEPDRSSLIPKTPYTYHRMDLISAQHTPCRHFERFATKDSTSLMLSPKAFNDPNSYLRNNETSHDVDRYIAYFSDPMHSNPGLKDGINDTVFITNALTGFWKNELTSVNNFVVWRYLGTVDGITRVYPAIELPKSYDPNVRPWFRRTLAFDDKQLVFSPVYDDGWGAGYVITMSRILYQQTSVKGVIAMDFALKYFYNLIQKELHPECKTDTCFVIDKSGYLVVHKDFIESKDCHQNRIENVHIIEKEPKIAEDMIANKWLRQESCLDFSNIKYQNFWTVTLKSDNGLDGKFKVIFIPGTNLYLVIKHEPFSTGVVNCDCPVSYTEPSENQCSATKDCSCPCYTRAANYKYCENKFTLGIQDDWPTCTPKPKTDSFFISTEKLNISTLDVCFIAKCEDMKTSQTCYGVAGCNWCHIDVIPPYCTSDRDLCPYGEVCSGRGVPVTSPPVTVLNRTSGPQKVDALNLAMIGGVAGGSAILIIVVVVIIAFSIVRKYRRNSPRVVHLPSTDATIEETFDTPSSAAESNGLPCPDPKTNIKQGLWQVKKWDGFDHPKDRTPLPLPDGIQQSPKIDRLQASDYDEPEDRHGLRITKEQDKINALVTCLNALVKTEASSSQQMVVPLSPMPSRNHYVNPRHNDVNPCHHDVNPRDNAQSHRRIVGVDNMAFENSSQITESM